MTKGKEKETLLEVPIGSVGRTGGWPKWAEAREAAGINPNDETANMFPSDAIVYRQLSGEKPVSPDVLGKKLRPNEDTKKARDSVYQALVRLRKILPVNADKSVVNVGTPNHAEYLLVDVGKEQETTERYAKEREKTADKETARRRADVDSRVAIRASKTVVGQIEALLNLGGEVTTDVIFDAVFGGRRTKNNLTEISRAIRKIDQKAQERGQTLVRSRVGGRTIYAIVNSEDAEKVKDELAKKGETDHAPKAKTISKPPSQEIILEESVEVDIIALDHSE